MSEPSVVGAPEDAIRRLFVYWCPRCEVQTERPWHLCKRGPGLIPQLDEETTCERIEVVPVADRDAQKDKERAEKAEADRDELQLLAGKAAEIAESLAALASLKETDEPGESKP